MKKILIITYLIFSLKLEGSVYLEPPLKFKPSREIAAVYIEYENQILLLHRQNDIVEGNKWAPPAGHVELNELPLETAIRETKEETGYDISGQQIEFYRTLYIEYAPQNHYLFHMFYTKLAGDPAEVKIDFAEHKGFTWVTPADALKMNLLKDEDECIRLLYF